MLFSSLFLFVVSGDGQLLLDETENLTMETLTLGHWRNVPKLTQMTNSMTGAAAGVSITSPFLRLSSVHVQLYQNHVSAHRRIVK